ncbi:MAG: RNA polymerase sigma-70 factor [Prevotella sp.]|nr:RNA polymerase sigma-70 factor [Prevotella sp.]MBQ6033642.1 RNA polymerase sigma-70 factor [Prevotella sp.]MBQ6658913.1 RNA polymerase sigma-70 factor [Prevotella sp.]
MEIKEFDQIFRQYYQELYFFAMQLLHDPEDSKDVVSDAFEEVWSHFSSVKKETVRYFLYRIVRNQCIDTLRHKKIQMQHAELMLQVTRPYDESMDTLEWQEREARVKEILDAMKPPTRDIFIACYVDHKKYAEVATLMAISIDTVKKHIKKALRFIREKRQQYEER